MQPRDWIVPMVEHWAAQKRRLLFPRKDGHIDGWDHMTLLGRILDEGPGASHSSGRVHQKHPEVYQGSALLIQRAMEKMPYHPRIALLAHHVITGCNARKKAEALKMSPSHYYSNLECAYHYLAGRIDEFHERRVA